MQFVLLLVALALKSATAQDLHFSRYYATPLYTNPALAGTGECSRLMMAYRNHWPSVSGGFLSYALEADHHFESLKSSVGAQIWHDVAGGVLKTTYASGIYAYRLQVAELWQVQAGLETGYIFRTIDWGGLVFPDMIDPVSGAVNPSLSGQPVPANTSKGSIDFSGGLLAGYNEKIFFGVAVHHFTRPDLSWYSDGSGYLERRYTFHGGANLLLGNAVSGNGSELVLSPNVLYLWQQHARQLSAGINLTRKPLELGIAYRNNLGGSDAVTVVAGLVTKRWRLGYAYDYTVSAMSKNTGGSHEVTMMLLIGCGKRNRPGAIKCPEF
ncbi:MAG: hypothetical protein Kow00127_14080 [Bacteroidales bacterium]